MGARKLVLSTAYYYTTSRVPLRLHDQNSHFQLLEFAPQYGSWQRDLLLNIFSSGVYDAAKAGLDGQAYPALFAGIAIGAAVGAVAANKYWLYSDPSPDIDRRIEPRFDSLPSANVAGPSERDQTLDVHEASRTGLEEALAPLGTSATHLQISINGRVVLEMRAEPRGDQEKSRRLNDEITRAVQELRRSS